jgi:putative ABC transport system ATP-binding protein
MPAVAQDELRRHPDGAAVPAARIIDGRKVYGRGPAAVVALDGVTADFPAARYTAVMGPSGSGKSTLMHCLAGLDTLTEGMVLLGGTDLSALDDQRRTLLRRTRIGFVFQAFNLLPMLTAAENITLPADLAGIRPDPSWLEDVIGVTGLADRLGHRPGQLSGGEQQRVAIARALATQPELVIADEPTGNLDSRTGQEILDLFSTAVRDLGRTVVMVTHDPAAAARSDRVLFLADGRLDGCMDRPTAERVLDRMKDMREQGAPR